MTSKLKYMNQARRYIDDPDLLYSLRIYLNDLQSNDKHIVDRPRTITELDETLNIIDLIEEEDRKIYFKLLALACDQKLVIRINSNYLTEQEKKYDKIYS